MSAAARFWEIGQFAPPRVVGYPQTPPRMFRAAPRTGVKRSRFTAGFNGGGFQRRVRARGGNGYGGRYAGRFRRVGYWGRYRGAGGSNRGGELKFHDIDWDQAAADFNAGVISNTSSLVLIGQATTESTRIGRKAVIHSIGWRAKLQRIAVASTGAAAPEPIRMILVQDKQCNGAAPSVAGDSGLLETANYQSFNSLANKGRYKVLFDKVFTLNTIAMGGNGTANDSAAVDRQWTFFKKCNIPIEYSGVANPSVIAEVRTNNIFGIMISQSANSTVTLDSKFRFRFSDG